MATCLILPGLNGSGADHWQTRWQASRPGCVRVQFGCWSLPDRRQWVARLEEAVGRAQAPVILVAHSLGCHAVAWWAAETASAAKVAAAMLVAPPDLDGPDLMAQLRSFAPPPRSPLSFPSLLVASRDDPYATFDSSARLAESWGAALADAGRSGHINVQSRLGDWCEGQRLLDDLIAGVEGDRAQGRSRPNAAARE